MSSLFSSPKVSLLDMNMGEGFEYLGRVRCSTSEGVVVLRSSYQKDVRKRPLEGEFSSKPC
jgi:hypothetical protein